MPVLVLFVIIFVTAYVGGSVNFSIVAFHVTGRDDPRNHGSKNPGATNVYRQAGPGWAALVLVLDVGRAMIVALLAKAWLPLWCVPWVGLGLILGNRFPCFHRFKGGKGVANYLGYTVVVSPGWAAMGAVAWGAAHAIWRTPFLSSFSMVGVMSLGTAFGTDISWKGGLGSVSTALFIVACHHKNIRERWGRPFE